MKKTLPGALLAMFLVGPGLSALAKAPNAPAPVTISRVEVLSRGDNFELEIHASDAVVPQTLVVAGPDRLVVDFPDSLPGHGLRPMIVSAGAVKGIRMGLFQSNPPVTRVVVDLKSPQAYQVFPSGRTIIVKIMPQGSKAALAAAAAEAPVAANAPPPGPPPPPAPTVQVNFDHGNLRIIADRVSLAQVLREVQRATGARVTLPPGADQELVVADVGPAPARQVLTSLLNGSSYNVILVGAGGDLAKITSIILTPRAGGSDMPMNIPPAVAEAAPEPEAAPPPPVQDIPPDPPAQQPDSQPPPPVPQQ